MVDRIRWDTVSYLPFYYVFFQFLLLTIFYLQANILTTKDILSNLDMEEAKRRHSMLSTLPLLPQTLYQFHLQKHLGSQKRSSQQGT